MSGDVFVDTNVLVYSRDASEGPKQVRATQWLSKLWDSGRGALSVQVLSCRFLLSEDLQDGMDFDGVVVIDPFSHQPSAILSAHPHER